MKNKYIWLVVHKWGKNLEKITGSLVLTETTDISELKKVYSSGNAPTAYMEGDKTFVKLLNEKRELNKKGDILFNENILELDSLNILSEALVKFLNPKKEWVLVHQKTIVLRKNKK